MTEKAYNDFIEKKDYVEVLYRNTGKSFICDIEDWQKVEHMCWSYTYHGYPVTNIGNNIVKRFHQVILDIPEGKVCDHINRDKSDNRRNNLRIVTQQKNTQNSSIRNDNKTGCTGVAYYKNLDKYRAYITINQKQINLGYFEDINQAILARLEAGRKYDIYTDICELEEDKLSEVVE